MNINTKPRNATDDNRHALGFIKDSISIFEGAGESVLAAIAKALHEDAEAMVIFEPEPEVVSALTLTEDAKEGRIAWARRERL